MYNKEYNPGYCHCNSKGYPLKSVFSEINDEGNKWYQFKAKDIDMLLPAMEDVKFEEIADEEERNK